MPKIKREITPQSVEQLCQFLKDNGAPLVVLRSDVAKYSCGFLHPATIRNADSLGHGPVNRVVFGDKRQAVGYPLESLARYMAERGFVIETRQESAA